MSRPARPFMEWVDQIPFSTCWYWGGQLDRKGYGRVKHDGRPQQAHRVSYILHKGPIPDGMCVCHSCDVPSCVNPDHLFLGSHLDNAKDRNAKGRAAKGENQGSAKLTGQQVCEIRTKVAFGQSMRSIAREYGIGKTHVSRIHHGRNWKHLAG